jgi:hypothetical protein
VRSVQFSSGQKKGVVFFGPASTPKNAQKTPQNAQKRPKTPQNAPKTPQTRPKMPQKRPFFGPENARFFQFSSVQVSFFRSGHFRSFQVSSGQVPDLIGRSVQVNLTCRADTAYLPKGIYGAWLLNFVSARTNKRHHHHSAHFYKRLTLLETRTQMAAPRPEHAHATDRPATATLPPRDL